MGDILYWAKKQFEVGDCACCGRPGVPLCNEKQIPITLSHGTTTLHSSIVLHSKGFCKGCLGRMAEEFEKSRSELNAAGAGGSFEPPAR